jgi:hypothetical protein
MQQMEQQQRYHNELMQAANETNERAVAAVATIPTQNNTTVGEPMNEIA